MFYTLAQVAIGGAIGASSRYLVNVTMTRLMGHGFPWGTLVVNALGSFLMGVLVVVLAKKGGHHLAPLFMVGMLGGFTTFSSFSLDAFTLFERGELALAAAYVIGTLALTLGAIVAGILVTRGLL